jgi:hypothetical protein
MKRRVLAFAFATFFAFALSSCSSTEPGGAELSPVTETVEVEVFGDAFVKSNGRRVPRERFVLELRHRVRAMEPNAAAGVRVVISQSDDAPEQATRDAEWILDQLQIMGVGQATYR